MSKLESMDSRLQNCEAQLIHPRTTATPPLPSSDPKGKAPMVSPRSSPIPSPTASHAPTSHIPSPHTSPSTRKSPPPDPIPIPSCSSHSSSSLSTSHSDPQQFELAARLPSHPESPLPLTPRIPRPHPQTLAASSSLLLPHHHHPHLHHLLLLLLLLHPLLLRPTNVQSKPPQKTHPTLLPLLGPLNPLLPLFPLPLHTSAGNSLFPGQAFHKSKQVRGSN